MCQMCGNVAAHATTLVFRPAHDLFGEFWEGSHAEAAAGAIRAVNARIGEASKHRKSIWKGPVVGISWNARPEMLRYFAGFACGEGEAVPPELSPLSVPEMDYASAWHGPDDGEVTEHYRAMIEWIEPNGLRWDTSHLHHREEHPADMASGDGGGLRLMLPVKPA